VKDAKQTSCLHIAVMRGHAHIVEYLLTKTPRFFEENFKEQETPMSKNDKLTEK